jgi:hypothetical protein
MRTEASVVDLDVVRFPVVLVALETDLSIFLVFAEHEWAGADRLLVQVFGLALLEQLRGVFSRLDGGEAHGHVLDESGIDTVQGELDGVLVDFLDLGDVGVHAHVGEVRELGRIGLAKRHVLVEHAVEGEQYVVGVEGAGRLEVVGGVELDPFAQMEDIGQSIRGHVPAGRQAGDDRGAAAFELAQAVEESLCRGIEVGSGGVLTRVETRWTAFGTKNQVACGMRERRTGEQACSNQERNDCVFEHGGLIFVI